MQIDRIEEMRLSPTDDREIAAFLSKAFNEDYEGRPFHQQRHHLRFVARDPHIVSHIALCYRAIRLGDDLVDIVGLAEVATDPARRGEGIASKLMEAAIAEARATAADFFVLFGVRPMYAGVGFVAMPNRLISTQLYHAHTGKVVQEEEQSLMVMPLKDKSWDPAPVVDLLGFKF